MNKTLKNVIRIVILVLISVLIGFSVYSINAIRLNGDALPMPLGFGVSVVLTGSMEPVLSAGDMIAVVPQETGRSAVVHRIIAIDGDQFITQGDANNAADDPISLSNIKGKVIIVIPFVGHIINLIKTPIGTIILLGLAIWLLEGSFKKDKKRDDKELDSIRAEIEKLKNEQK